MAVSKEIKKFSIPKNKLIQFEMFVDYALQGLTASKIVSEMREKRGVKISERTAYRWQNSLEYEQIREGHKRNLMAQRHRHQQIGDVYFNQALALDKDLKTPEAKKLVRQATYQWDRAVKIEMEFLKMLQPRITETHMEELAITKTETVTGVNVDGLDQQMLTSALRNFISREERELRIASRTTHASVEVGTKERADSSPPE